MSESKEQQKNVDAIALQIALLDEIAGRLLSIETHNKELTPEGIVDPLVDITVTTTPIVVGPSSSEAGKYWFSVSVINDGPNYCWVVINTGKSSTRPHKVANDETYEVTFTKALIYDLRLYTDEGTAVLRITGTR